MKTAARETASHIAPRGCSEEEEGKGEYICDYIYKGEFMQASTCFFVERLSWLPEASAGHKKQLSP